MRGPATGRWRRAKATVLNDCGAPNNTPCPFRQHVSLFFQLRAFCTSCGHVLLRLPPYSCRGNVNLIHKRAACCIIPSTTHTVSSQRQIFASSLPGERNTASYCSDHLGLALQPLIPQKRSTRTAGCNEPV
jgi:hypothetical protein